MAHMDEKEDAYAIYLRAYSQGSTVGALTAVIGTRDCAAQALGVQHGTMNEMVKTRKEFMTKLGEMLDGTDDLAPDAKVLASDLGERILSAAFGDEALQAKARDLLALIIETAT